MNCGSVAAVMAAGCQASGDHLLFVSKQVPNISAVAAPVGIAAVPDYHFGAVLCGEKVYQVLEQWNTGFRTHRRLRHYHQHCFVVIGVNNIRIIIVISISSNNIIAKVMMR